MTLVWLALRDLAHDRFFLICNAAIMVGVLVPLLVLFGVKNGVYSALIGQMMADPAYRQIDTSGNGSFTGADIAPLADWPEIAFLTPRIRGQFDYVNVRAAEGRRIRAAVVIPSGAGDPNLPAGYTPGPGTVAVSAALAASLDLVAGAELELITQAEDRPRQLVLPARVGAVLPDSAVAGTAVLAPFEMLDLIEAFYDAYALPEHGILAGRPLDQRVAAYAGVRVYAARLEDLAALQQRLEQTLGVKTSARTRDVASLLGLGRNLDLVLRLTALLAAVGLGAALLVGFWSEVGRKRAMLAAIALLGVPPRRLALIPMVQALVTALLGLAVSFALFAVAGRMVAGLFGAGLPAGARLVVLPPAQAAGIALAVLGLVLIAAGLAALIAQRLDPASILRQSL